MITHKGFFAWAGAMVLVGTMVSCDASAGQPYVGVGVAYAFDTPYGQSMDDGYYSWKGNNPVAIIEAGYEFDSGLDVGYLHISNWFTGFPFNNKGETGLDLLQLKYRWRF